MTLPTEPTFQAWHDYVNKLPALGELWVESAGRFGNPLLISDTTGTSLSAKRALTGSIILARRIKKISPEQNIGILLPSSAGGMLANLAGMLLGKTVINLNFTANGATLLSSISQGGIKTIYTSSRFLEKLQERGFDQTLLEKNTKLIMLEDIVDASFPFEKVSIFILCSILPVFLLKILFCKKTNLDDTAIILFSSGSEGEPKGVLLSHRNLVTNVKQIIKLLKVHDDDLIFANLPLFHAFGLTVTLFMPLLHRVQVICHPDPTDVYNCAKAISKHKISILFGTSSFFRLYIRNSKIKNDMLGSLRLLVAGAEKLQQEVKDEFQNKFNKTIYEGYGATETSPVATANIPTELIDPSINLSISNKLGSAGLPLPGTQLRIVDPDTLEELPAGTAGRILINGGQIMKGYLNNPEQSKQALPVIDGFTWFASGDKGYVDEDGFLFIQDRYSRFAKIAGEMISLGGIENSIKEVMQDPDLEVIAVNLPDSKKGEKIVVLSTQILDSAVLRDKLKKVGLSSLNLPSSYIKIDEVPCLGSGKTDYNAAKKTALKITS